MKRLLIGVALLGSVTLAGLPPAGSQPSQQSTCTPDVRICFNEIASTQDSNGVWTIRANTDDSDQVTGEPAFRRAILIFHLLRDPATGKYVPYLVAQAPWCFAISNCYVEWKTSDPFALSDTLWWGATLDNNNHIEKAMVGYPSP